MLVLSESDIQGLVSIQEAVDLMRIAYTELGHDQAQNIPRGRMVLQPDRRFFFNCIPGMVPSMNACSVRLDAYIRPIRNNRYVGLVLLFSIDTGEWVATLPDFTISAIRVAATSAMVTDRLARRGARTLGIFGSGHQARAHLQAISLVRPIERIRAYSPTAEHLHNFCEQMSRLLGRDVRPASANAVVEDADIVVAATDAIEPVFDGSLLAPGSHTVTIRARDKFGAAREVDSATCKRADLVAYNSLKQIELDGQEAEAEALQHIRSTGRGTAIEISDLLVGKHPGRTNDEQRTLYFNNCGQGIQFAAIAQHIYEKARDRRIGREVPAEWFYTDLQPAIEQGRVGSRWTDPRRGMRSENV